MKTSQKTETCYNSRRNGYVLLITILVIGAVGIASTAAIILTGVGATKTSISLQRMNRAKLLADTCLETALEKVRADNNFSGGANLTFVYGSCSYSVPGGGTPKTVTASGTAGSAVRRVRAVITSYRPKIVLSSWREVAD